MFMDQRLGTIGGRPLTDKTETSENIFRDLI